ncbi:MAG TPA: peptidase [Acidimicrobiaceae bacterium]|nr:peptidase [Acidimicrobiaceae bacterium]
MRAKMLVHAKACLPNEACGYLVGSETGRIQRFVPITSAAGSPTRFVFEPHEQLAAEQAIDAAGEQVIGIAHSHPNGEPLPSAVDTADAGRFDPLGILLRVVIAPTTGEIRSHRIINGEVAAM